MSDPGAPPARPGDDAGRAERAAAVDELWHREQIRDCLLRYCRGLDRRDFELVRSSYHADAYDDHGDFKGDVNGLIDWMRRRHADVEQCMHAITNCLIERAGDVAMVETYLVTFQRPRRAPVVTRPDGAPPDLEQVLAAVRFLDRFELRHGVWKVASRQVVFESVLQLPAPGADAGSRTPPRRDASDPLWLMRDEVLRLRN